jgi:hypothetical protein
MLKAIQTENANLRIENQKLMEQIKVLKEEKRNLSNMLLKPLTLKERLIGKSRI